MIMKRILSIFLICTALLLSQLSRAQYAWDGASNAELYASLLSYVKSCQTDLIGEPAYYMAQELMVELKAAYKRDPYVWMTQVHNFCNRLEAMYPPVISHPAVSRAAEDRYDKIRRVLTRLRDYPMHQVSLNSDIVAPASGQADAFHAANKQWLQLKRREFFSFLRGPRPSGSELQVAKLYSSGVVLRTREACIGIDICYGEGLYDSEFKEELADMLDVLYVTHAHGDHYDIELMKMMLAKGKPVVGPHTMARHFTSVSGEKHFWEDTHLEPELIGGVANTQAYMSGQGDEPCLLYLIQIGQWRVTHIGDNSKHDNEAKIYPLYERADIVIGPVFQGVVNYLNNTLAAPNPGNIEQFYLNIHENEWHHTVDHRVSYNFLYTNAGALSSRTFNYCCTTILECGEFITLYK